MAASSTPGQSGNGPSASSGTWYKDGREQALHKYIFSRPDLETTLRDNPPAVLAAVEEFIRTDTFMMTYRPAKIEQSRNLLAQMSPPPKTLVELGAYVGNSAVAWGAMLKELNPDGGCRVFTVELDEEFATITRDMVALAGVDDVVTVLQGKSTEILSSLRGAHGVDKIDVLFLDHWEKFYLPDLQTCEDLGLFRKGSLVLADNTDIPGAPEYLAYVKAGGRGGKGEQGKTVRYESTSYETTTRNVMSVVEASLVVEVP